MGAMGRRDGPHLHDLGSKWSRLVLISGLQRHIGHSQPLLAPHYPSPNQAYPPRGRGGRSRLHRAERRERNER